VEAENETRRMVERSTILRGLVGSTVHGLSVSDQDDRDEMGICVEPWAHFFGLRPRWEQYVYRTQPEGARSGPGDLDLVVYSLAKWARLALGGNPTILTLLFLPPSAIVTETPLGAALRGMRADIVGDSIYGPYLGYMEQQRRRLTNKVKMPNRPELVERYGFDTKYAGHLLRLGYQGIELAETGALTLPMREPERSHIIAVRTGKHTEAEVLDEARGLEERLKFLRDTNPLPPANSAAVERFVIDAYMAQQSNGAPSPRLAALEAVERAAKLAARRCTYCHGSGSMVQPCQFCLDSTHDHECPTDLVPCPSEKCALLRSALAASEAARG
jgi:predicted nucleotidyltransferase